MADRLQPAQLPRVDDIAQLLSASARYTEKAWPMSELETRSRCAQFAIDVFGIVPAVLRAPLWVERTE